MRDAMTCAILLSGGVGARLGSGMPKQYLALRARPVITYSLRTLDAHPAVDAIVIVADAAWREAILRWMEMDGIAKFLAFADPGRTRQLSVLSALERVRACGTHVGFVLIHDAARPLVSADLISRCMDALPGHDGVMPALRAKDTYYLTDAGGRVAQLLNRSMLVAGQAPEVFAYKKYYGAHLGLPADALLRLNGSAEVAVLGGLDIVTVQGDERNIKITTPNDLLLAERYLEEQAKGVGRTRLSEGLGAANSRARAGTRAEARRRLAPLRDSHDREVLG